MTAGAKPLLRAALDGARPGLLSSSPPTSPSNDPPATERSSQSLMLSVPRLQVPGLLCPSLGVVLGPPRHSPRVLGDLGQEKTRRRSVCLQAGLRPIPVSPRSAPTGWWQARRTPRPPGDASLHPQNNPGSNFRETVPPTRSAHLWEAVGALEPGGEAGPPRGDPWPRNAAQGTKSDAPCPRTAHRKPPPHVT